MGILFCPIFYNGQIVETPWNKYYFGNKSKFDQSSCCVCNQVCSISYVGNVRYFYFYLPRKYVQKGEMGNLGIEQAISHN